MKTTTSLLWVRGVFLPILKGEKIREREGSQDWEEEPAGKALLGFLPLADNHLRLVSKKHAAIYWNY